MICGVGRGRRGLDVGSTWATPFHPLKKKRGKEKEKGIDTY